MQVIGYCRVSTGQQARDGLSLDAQQERIRAYCQAYGYTLVRIVVDTKSGESLNRPGIRECLDALESGEATGLVVCKLDRITRKLSDICRLTDKYFGEGRKFRLMSVSEHIDTSTPGGRMMLNILGTFAQHEREMISERTRETAAYQKAAGKRWGEIPFGYDLADDGETLLPNAAEQETLEAIRRLSAEGWSQRKIAAELNRLGVPTKKRIGPWSHSSVRWILERMVSA